LDRINYAIVTLIPKVDIANLVKDFRPISLVNCILKIFTKVLANRLDPQQCSLVHDSQSAFQANRSSLDSIVIASEVVHSCSKRKSEIALCKIDFMKAYDCVDWNFIVGLLEARGFGVKWISWIKMNFNSYKYSVHVNGIQSNTINCKRGLKQGDPLSPVLFILAADVLQRMVVLGSENGHLSELNLMGELKNTRSLQFADDTLIFCKANRADITNLKLILYLFEGFSGLSINFAKSSLVYFGKYASRGLMLASLLHCPLESLPFKYLGLPLNSRKLTKRDWQPLVDKCFHR